MVIDRLIRIKDYRLSISTSSKLLVCLFVFICIKTNPLLAGELRLNDQQLIDFADYLYHNQEYYRAISEYKRHQHFFPESPLSRKASLQIGRSYMAGGDHQAAIQYWQLRLEKQDADEISFNQIRMLLGISLLDLDKDLPFRLRQENIDKAFQQFSKVKESGAESKFINDFQSDWKTRPPSKYKSPWLAGTMSAAIPGSGSFYSGRYIEGTYAFFLTFLFGLAAHDAVQNDQPELATVFGFFTLTFYGGSIYTAVNSVHKTNDKMDADELFRLRKKHGIWLIPETIDKTGRF